jgi:CDP-paratose 2-epimerase
MKVLITGSGGLIGSACAANFADRGWEICGLDNNMREQFFGAAGSIRSVVHHLEMKLPSYRHHWLDIRNREAIRDLVKRENPDMIIHTAAQPSHDKAAVIPYDDFDVNCVGTLNLLVAARDFCAEVPFCFTSTNKVYGDRPNLLRLQEEPTRWDYSDGRDGIDETMSIDQCKHSLFGASKLAADVLCQEFGRYFSMPVGIFRGGCLTGRQHAAVELHGYLAYIIRCAVTKSPYTVFGYRAKQVRDQIHCDDVANLFQCFFEAPTCGEVYNLGGGRANSISILETVAALDALGHRLNWSLNQNNRVGDHICYITDYSKLQRAFPQWRIERSLDSILIELVAEQEQLLRQAS